VLHRFPPGTPPGDAVSRPIVRDVIEPGWSAPRLWEETALLYQRLVQTAIAALLLTLVFRTTLLRLLGLEIVTRDGQPASRLRVLARAAIAWSPVLVAAIWLPPRGDLFEQAVDHLWTTRGCVLLLLAGAAYAAARPARAIQDRLAGTWLVPR
jgi:hypothetical protein